MLPFPHAKTFFSISYRIANAIAKTHLRCHLNLSDLLSLSFLFTIFLHSCKQQEIPAVDPRNLTPEILCGTVEFTDGCGPAVDTLNRFGLTLIHHMTYEEAAYTFDQVIKKDPDCFWGYWGKAMCFIHPLWPDVISDQDMINGYILAQKALVLAKSEKEKLYGDAVAAFYVKNSKTKLERLADLQKGWQRAHDQMPDDPEAELFNGLFRLAIVPPSDTSYVVQNEVGEMAERILSKYPDHPGAFHYAIHAYDVPPLADKALRIARSYGNFALHISHALHIPSLVFTRLGYWQASIDWNWRAADAALHQSFDELISPYTFHASDYIVYAMLQLGEDVEARKVWQRLDSLSAPLFINPSTAYVLASIPARLVLERHDWKAAANLTDPDTVQFPWKKYPQYEAIFYMTQGLGAARSGDVATGRAAVVKLTSLQTTLKQSKAAQNWLDQVEIAKKIVSAWTAFADHHQQEALVIMRSAVDMEDETTYNPVSPGSLLPARELLGDMLLENNQPLEAIAAYDQSAIHNPNRYNTFLGAGLAAEKIKDLSRAKGYYEKLIAHKGESPCERPSYSHAEKMLGQYQ